MLSVRGWGEEYMMLCVRGWGERLVMSCVLVCGERHVKCTWVGSRPYHHITRMGRGEARLVKCTWRGGSEHVMSSLKF